jgi:hypothetical protein
VVRYLQFVHPRFPVLSLQNIDNIMDDEDYVGIRSAIFALAAPFTYLDDELSVSRGYAQLPTEKFWGITQRSYRRSLESSGLPLLQLCLLLLQMPPLNFAVAESPHPWALACSAVAIAESLGLNLDPSDWRLPRREVQLRKRLWWWTFVQHTWFALVFGRPSHLNDDNWDVPPLSVNDLEDGDSQDPTINTSIIAQRPYLLALCELSTIAADILKAF